MLSSLKIVNIDLYNLNIFGGLRQTVFMFTSLILISSSNDKFGTYLDIVSTIFSTVIVSAFESRDKLKGHQRAHSDFREFLCYICGAAVKNREYISK